MYCVLKDTLFSLTYSMAFTVWQFFRNFRLPFLHCFGDSFTKDNTTTHPKNQKWNKTKQSNWKLLKLSKWQCWKASIILMLWKYFLNLASTVTSLAFHEHNRQKTVFEIEQFYIFRMVSQIALLMHWFNSEILELYLK